jgi:LPXTG-site transpeptidase (sortase) family protein
MRLKRKRHYKAEAKTRQSRTKKWLFIAIPTVLFAAGAYILINVFSPALPPQPFEISEIEIKENKDNPIKENRLYIPDIGVDVQIVQGGVEALEKGTWHRKPENGDPEKGGNFVLSAHRFELGFTPQQTRARSPFYHIDKLQTGDRVFVDYNHKRYAYEVTKKYKVDRYAVEIENPSEEPKLTLYSCDLKGEAAGREVIEAKPLDI